MFGCLFALWHNVICQVAFGGELPEWLLKLHQLLGLA